MLLVDDRIALLLLRCVHRAWNSRQLQHGRVLAFAQPGEQHGLTVGELQRIPDVEASRGIKRREVLAFRRRPDIWRSGLLPMASMVTMKKRPRDPSQLAKLIVDIATGAAWPSRA
jgi:hypothetical protein